MAIRSPIFFTAEDGSVIFSSIDYTAHVKDITIEGGDRDAELLRAFGNKTFFIPRPQDAFEATFTLMGSDTARHWSFLMGGVYAGAAQDGSLFGGDGSRATVNLEVNFTEPGAAGAAWKFYMSGAYATSVNAEMGTDNQLEETISFKAEPAKCFVGMTPTRSVIPLK